MATAEVATILSMAGEQHGVVSRAQMRAVGVSDDQLTRLVSGGVLEVAQRGILRVSGARPSWLQDLAMGVLRIGPGARVSHRAAVRLWELDGIGAAPIELSVPYGRRIRLPALVVHLSSDLDETPAERQAGLPVTSVARTLVDVGAVVRPVVLERVLDDALRRRLTSVDELDALVRRLGRHGRSGVPALRELLAERRGVDAVTETGFETQLLRVLRRHGLPRPATQYRLHDRDGSFVMRFDAAYLDAKVGIEADSERWHMDRQRFQDDRRKRARAAALGWRVLAFTYAHVTRDAGFVADTVGRALRHAAA